MQFRNVSTVAPFRRNGSVCLMASGFVWNVLENTGDSGCTSVLWGPPPWISGRPSSWRGWKWAAMPTSKPSWEQDVTSRTNHLLRKFTPVNLPLFTETKYVKWNELNTEFVQAVIVASVDLQIATLADGKPWSEETSSAQSYVPHKPSGTAGLKVVNSNGAASVQSNKDSFNFDSGENLEDFLNRLVLRF